MKKSTKIWAFFIVLLLVAVGAGTLAYAKRDVTPTFDTVEVTRQTVTITVDGTGTIRKADPVKFDKEGNKIEDLVIKEGDKVVVDILVPESDILKIEEGQAATMTLDAFGSDVEFTGKVLKIADLPTAAEGVVMYKVAVSLDEQSHGGKGDLSGMKAGMTADVTIVTSAYKNVLAVPARTIVRSNGSTFVRMPDAAKEEGYVEREVVTGARGDNSLVVITSGLREGDDVIVDLD